MKIFSHNGQKGNEGSNVCIFVVTFVVLVAVVRSPAEERVLRVAAEPNNLPFSNKRGEGLEDKIAELIAGELHCKLEYEWRAQRRRLFRETLKNGEAELV